MMTTAMYLFAENLPVHGFGAPRCSVRWPDQAASSVPPLMTSRDRPRLLDQLNLVDGCARRQALLHRRFCRGGRNDPSAQLLFAPDDQVAQSDEIVASPQVARNRARLNPSSCPHRANGADHWSKSTGVYSNLCGLLRPLHVSKRYLLRL
jgi:hypothetical protein